jgi:hypothetical protein
VIEVRGERFDQGDEYAQVTRSPIGAQETTFLVERADELREIKLRCTKTGTYACWLMTEAQGGTFVDVEFGMDPKTFGDKIFDTAFGRLFFRRWLEESMESLRQAAAREAEAPAAT